MDRLYTSVSTATWLLSKNITCVGTLQTRRVGIPEEIRSTQNREEYSSKVFWEKEKGDMSITSYVVPSSKGMKNVLVLSTMHPILGTTKDDGKQKPVVFKLYDFTKGGTDQMDQRIGIYSTKTKSSNWTRVAFSHVFDTACVNTSTVFALSYDLTLPNLDSFELLWKLVESLVLTLAQSRKINSLSTKTPSKAVTSDRH